MHKQMIQFLEINNLLYNRQGGYRANNSCDDITADLIDEVLTNKKSKLKNSILFVDYTSAFDLMPINRLVEKCKGYRFTSNQASLISSYLKNRSYVFSVHGHLSRKCQLSSGVPQGSVLGP